LNRRGEESFESIEKLWKDMEEFCPEEDEEEEED